MTKTIKMTKGQKTEIFESYRGYIEKIAWKFHYYSGIEVDELIGQSFLVFTETIDFWEEEKGEVSTFILTSVSNGLKDYCKKQRSPVCISFSEEIQEQKKTQVSYMALFEENPDPIIQAIATVIKSLFPPPAGQAEKIYGRKYGWLDKKVNNLTGISFAKIWRKYPVADSIVKGGA